MASDPLDPGCQTTGCTDPVPLSEEPWGYHPPAA